jgi:Lipopolysaccharide-assembly
MNDLFPMAPQATKGSENAGILAPPAVGFCRRCIQWPASTGGKFAGAGAGVSLINLVTLIALAGAGCGYHVGSHTDLFPKDVQVIAIPPLVNNTMRPKLPALLQESITREFHERTHYTIVADPNQADVVLRAAIAKFVNFPIIADPASGRATGAGCIVTMNLVLTDRHTNKTLLSLTGVDFRQNYEIAIDAKTYFDESDTALQRLSRDVGRSVVSAILEHF